MHKTLVITTADDGVAPEVLRHCDPRRFVHIDTLDLGRCGLCIANGNAHLLVEGALFPLTAFDRVWIRHFAPSFELRQITDTMLKDSNLTSTMKLREIWHHLEQHFAIRLYKAQQTVQSIQMLAQYFRTDAEIMNDLHAVSAADNKLRQLEVASQIGFRVPETLFTNNGDEVIAFQHRLGDVSIICKPLDPLLIWTSVDRKKTISAGLQVYTNPSKLASLARVILPLPRIWQREIVGQIDARITIVDTEVVGCCFWPRSGKATGQPDFRYYYDSLEYAVFPQTILDRNRERLLELNRRLGLKYSSCDFYLDPTTEDITFIEANSSGQSLWPRYYLGDQAYPIVAILASWVDGRSACNNSKKSIA